MNTLERIATTTDNYIDSKLPQSEQARERRKNRVLKPLAVVAGLSVAFGAYKGIEHATSDPEFSEETHSVIVEDGDSIYTVVENINDIETIDRRDAMSYVTDMPENQATLEDGLQPGETVIVPESVER